jgi:hypothetical protein
MHAPAPNGLAPDALDARQFVDRAEGMGVAVGQDIAHARWPNTGNQGQFFRRGSVEIHNPFELGLLCPHLRHEEHKHPHGNEKHSQHAVFSATAAKKLPAPARNRL